MIYLIDSNVYVHGFRDIAFGTELRKFHHRNLPYLVLSAVVVHELLVEAVTTPDERSLRRGIVEPFRLRQRLHVPVRQTWDLATRIDKRSRNRRNSRDGEPRRLRHHFRGCRYPLHRTVAITVTKRPSARTGSAVPESALQRSGRTGNCAARLQR